MQSLLVYFIIMLCGCMSNVNAQGCSDAGFCSIGNIKSHHSASDTLNKNYVAFGLGYGAGAKQTQYINPYAEYGRWINNSFSVQAKITAANASGFLGNNFNLGDVFLFATYRLNQKLKNNYSFLLGAKIPLNNSNNKNSDGVVLPLDYQSSLGTFDVIAGVNYVLNDHWEFNGALQIPVINKNKNTFFPSLFADEQIKDFVPTNNFERKSDALVRTGYIFNFSSARIKLKPNFLAIYHVANDVYQTPSGQTMEIENSVGLTLNGGLHATYNFKKLNQLEVVFASPFVVREERPDGLTRSIVFNVQYKILF